MLSISTSVRRLLLPCFLLTGVLLGSGSAQQGSVDMATAGGFILVNGANANFGLNARDPSDPSGHVNYVDHGTGLHVRSTDITAYIIVNATTRQIEGTAVLNDGTTVTFVVIVSDLGEPGTSDTFSISLSNGYSASGTLAGGNVQVHSPAP
jgi:hypothetical protein